MILIENMEMPTNCFDCFLMRHMHCSITYDLIPLAKRLDNCPLHEVSNNSPELDKENGELISRQDVKRMSDKPILSLKLNEQLNGFRKAMDEFVESCTKILEKYGLYSDETECEQPDTDTISKPQWIPVTERLPEKDGDYLTTLADKDGNYVDVTEWQNIIGGRWVAPLDECDYCEIGNVIAWMPLPEPFHNS